MLHYSVGFRRVVLALAVLCSCSFNASGLGDSPSSGALPGGTHDGDPSHPPVGLPTPGPPLVPGIPTGLLQGTSQRMDAATIDLTQEGSVDWAEWGMTRETDFNHKMGGGALSNLSPLGGAAFHGFGNTYVAPGILGFVWTDGMPTRSSGMAQRSGVYVMGVGAGLQMQVPAGPTVRTLRVYVGNFNGQGQLTAHLSDASAQDYIDTGFGGTALAVSAGVYTLAYRAASEGQMLQVTWVQVSGATGDVTWSAATLQ